MVQQAPAPPAEPRSETASAGAGWRARVPALAAGAVALIALISMAAAVGLAVFGRFQPVRRVVDDLLFPAPPNFAYAAFLLVLAAALQRRKHVAFHILALFLLLQGAVDTLVIALWGTEQATLIDQLTSGQGRPYEGEWLFAVNLAITWGLLLALFAARGEFYGRTKRGGVRQAIGVFGVLLTGFVGLGYGLVWAFPGSLEDPWERLTWTVERVLGGAVVFDITRVGHAPGWLNLVLGLFGASALFAALFLMLRAQRVASALSAEDERGIRSLLAQSGDRDSLGYFATRRDKAALFSPSGKAAITYRVVSGVCLASGDPLGDPQGWGPAIDRWLAMCREYTWVPAALGVSEPGATAYDRAGFKVLQLGDEAILHTAEFGLDGREMRPVRQAVNRVARSGHTARIRRHAEIPADEMARTAQLAREWRHTEAERGFSMALGRLGDPGDGECVLVEVLDPHGDPVGLLSLTPWGRRGLSLDLMRRDGAADNGVVEFMVCSLMQSAGRLGVDRVSLNFAMFRSAFDEGSRIGAGPVLRAWRQLLMLFSRWWQLESLYRSNVKYQPRWSPRFVAFGEKRDLARVGVAAAIAEGFLPASGDRTALDAATGTAEPEPSPAGEPATAAREGPEQARVRLDKLAALRAGGVDPYPVQVPRSERLRSVRDRHPELPADHRTGERTSVAGRVLLLRDHGGVCFATLRDFSGDLQVLLTTADTGAAALRSWREQVDAGDQVSVTGEVITSAHGELSVLAAEWTMAGKCLHPLPNKHRGLTDPEARARQRYVDLITRPQARDALRARSAAVHAVRDALVRADFLEVETPVLQPVHGGANARPFTTRSNAYDMRLHLRIAPELYLKRLCVGGVDKLFELGRAFRNEGVSHKHNPEFTVLEVYEAFGDYRSARLRCQDLVQAAATAVNGSPAVRRRTADGGAEEVDISGEWPVITVHEAVSAAVGAQVTADTPLDELREFCAAAGVSHDPRWERGAVLLELYEQLVEPHTTRPTFFTDFPAEVSPLARGHRDDPRLAERWDLVAFGAELGTGYSELTDPVEQRRRLTAQSWLAAGGDPEAMEIDEDFLTALEYAMPPTGGLGLGIDRLIMLLTGSSIRETLPFPLVKPRG